MPFPFRSLLVPACAAGMAAVSASANPFVYEGFATPGDYEPGLSLTEQKSGGAGGWISDWISSSTDVEETLPGTALTETYSIEAAGPPGTPGKLITAANVSVRRSFDPDSFTNLGIEIWFSHSFTRQKGSNNHHVFITGPGSFTRYFGVRSENDPSDELHVALRFEGSDVEKSAASLPLVNAVDYLVIGRMQFEDSGKNRLDVWVNPPDFTSVEALGEAHMFVETERNYREFSDVSIANGANAEYEFDEIRIARSLEDLLTTQ